MKNRMFIFMFSALMSFCVSNEINAQKEKSFGVSAGIGFSDEIDFAKVGVEFNMDINEHFRFSPSADFYLSSSSCVSLNGDFSYLIKSSEKFEIFPIVGVAYITDEFDLSFDRVGLNVGAGVQYDLSNNFALNAKAKYQVVKSQDNVVIGVGVVKKF